MMKNWVAPFANVTAAEMMQRSASIIQEAINSHKADSKHVAPISFTFYNKDKLGISKVYARVGNYSALAVDVCKKQLDLLFEFALTNTPSQIFPLPDEVKAECSAEELESVADARQYMFKKVIGDIKGIGRMVKVYPYFEDPNMIDVRVRLFGAELGFYIDKRSEMGEVLRKKHIIL